MTYSICAVLQSPTCQSVIPQTQTPRRGSGEGGGGRGGGGGVGGRGGGEEEKEGRRRGGGGGGEEEGRRRRGGGVRRGKRCMYWESTTSPSSLIKACAPAPPLFWHTSPSQVGQMVSYCTVDTCFCPWCDKYD